MPSEPHNLPVPARLPAGLSTGYGEKMPALFLGSAAGAKRFWEFFTANIRNRNTRRAYFVAVSQFSTWCEGRKLALEQVADSGASGPLIPV